MDYDSFRSRRFSSESDGPDLVFHNAYDYQKIGSQTHQPVVNDVHPPPSNFDEGAAMSSHSAPSPPDPALVRDRIRRRNPFRSWMYEAIAMVLSAGLVVAVASILLHFQDKEAPKWPHEITLNTVIAVLSTILRASLVFVTAEVISHLKWAWFDTARPLQHLERFDSASRGVWGSIRLFFITWKPHMALIGALVIVTSLAIGPFTQQALRTTVCQLPLNSSAPSIKAAHYVDETDFFIGGHTLPSAVLRTSMRGAIVDGMINSQSPSIFGGFICESGNCTFPSYEGVTHSSIGFCSKCDDITGSIRERFISRNESSTGNAKRVFQLNSQTQITLDEQGSWMVATAYQSPQAPYVHTQDFSLLTFTYASCEPFFNETSNRTEKACKHDHPHLPHLSSGIDIMAANCSLFPCLRNYEGSVVNGALKERLVSTTPTNVSISDDIRDHPRLPFDDFPVIKTPCLVDGVSYDANNISSVPAKPGRNMTWAIQDGGKNITAPLECAYSMPWGLNFGITNTLETSLNGTCLFEFLSNTGGEATDPSNINCDWDGGNWLLVDMYNKGNATLSSVAKVVGNVATSITNRMRNTGLDAHRDGPGVVRGEALRTTVCTRVNWRWIALPAVLTAIVLFLLLWVLAQSWWDRESRPVWKSSPLPLLVHGLGFHVTGRQALIHVSEMKVVATKTDVRLGKGALDFELVESRDGSGKW